MYHKRRVCMFHKNHAMQIFEFNTLDDEEMEIENGWRENPADIETALKPTPEVVQVDEQKAEETPETITTVTTDSAETITQDTVIEDNYTCDICGKECKGALSLRMHKLHKHKVK